VCNRAISIRRFAAFLHGSRSKQHGERLNCGAVVLAKKVCARLGVAYTGSSIVILEIPGATEKLKALGIRATMRGDRVRLAIHIYNDAEDVESLIKAVESR
jgi:selenocysteine lyase/cysteine desulfurase